MMKQQGSEVLEGIGAGQVARLDQTHERVADLCPLLGLEEQGVLAVEDGPFEDLLA